MRDNTLNDIPNNAEESVVEVAVEKFGKIEAASGKVEEECEKGDCAGDRTTDNDNLEVMGSTQRDEVARLTALDDTLKTIRQLADGEMNGYV